MIIKDYSKKYIEDLKKEFEERLNEAGELITESAKDDAPVKTGTYKNSINYEVDKDTVKIGSSDDKDKVYVIEYGSRNIKPKLIFTRAYKNNLSKIKKIFTKKLK